MWQKLWYAPVAMRPVTQLRLQFDDTDWFVTVIGTNLLLTVPGYISRSVAGSYDNEGIAIFALQFTYFLWVGSDMRHLYYKCDGPVHMHNEKWVPRTWQWADLHLIYLWSKFFLSYSHSYWIFICGESLEWTILMNVQRLAIVLKFVLHSNSTCEWFFLFFFNLCNSMYR